MFRNIQNISIVVLIQVNSTEDVNVQKYRIYAEAHKLIYSETKTLAFPIK